MQVKYIFFYNFGCIYDQLYSKNCFFLTVYRTHVLQMHQRVC
uniref:Uncharacterized protein n=1 Tax=Anguilla anguilla TaxID=7936 RepID=A0A0E9XCH6_ANGAN